MTVSVKGMPDARATIHSKTISAFATFIAAILLVLSLPSYANEQVEKEISQYVSNTMDDLILVLKENQPLYSKDSARFYQDLNQGLSKVIDFKRIAMKVMGKYGRKASLQEREAFVSVFKQSLYKTYANTLLENSDVSTKVHSAKVNTRNPKKAKVDLEITAASGASFPVTYSMHQGKDGVYRVENILVLGINIGLALREHFQDQIKRFKGDIGAVIASWSFEQVEKQSA